MKFYIITGATIDNKPIDFKGHYGSRNAAIDTFFQKYEKNWFHVRGLQVEKEIVKDNDKHKIEYVCSPVGNRFTVARVMC